VGVRETLFRMVDPQQAVLGEVLDRYHDGLGDPLTTGMLDAP
jgi:hypothetical protein